MMMHTTKTLSTTIVIYACHHDTDRTMIMSIVMSSNILLILTICLLTTHTAAGLPLKGALVKASTV